VYAEGKYFISGRGEEFPMIYRESVTEDTEIEPFIQPGEDRTGMRDLTWDGELIWGARDGVVYGFTTDGEVIIDWIMDNDHNNLTLITWDSDRDVLWLTHVVSSRIYAYDREGNWIENLTVEIENEIRLRKYGLAYFPDDSDGFPLYVMTFDQRDEPNPSKVYKFNPENGDTMIESNIEVGQNLRREEGQYFRPYGIHITSELDPYSWVFMNVANIPTDEGGDRVEVWQVETRIDWFDIEPTADTLAAGEQQELTITLNTADSDSLLAEGEFRFVHNSDSGSFVLPVWLGVGPVEVPENESALPQEFGINSVYPNPFNSWTNVRFYLENNDPVTLSIVDILGREVRKLWDGDGEMGVNSISWNATDVPSGIYFIRLATLERSHTVKIALLK
jgi:hypothetical protein